MTTYLYLCVEPAELPGAADLFTASARRVGQRSVGPEIGKALRELRWVFHPSPSCMCAEPYLGNKSLAAMWHQKRKRAVLGELLAEVLDDLNDGSRSVMVRVVPSYKGAPTTPVAVECLSSAALVNRIAIDEMLELRLAKPV